MNLSNFVDQEVGPQEFEEITLEVCRFLFKMDHVVIDLKKMAFLIGDTHYSSVTIADIEELERQKDRTNQFIRALRGVLATDSYANLRTVLTTLVGMASDVLNQLKDLIIAVVSDGLDSTLYERKSATDSEEESATIEVWCGVMLDLELECSRYKRLLTTLEDGD